MKVNPPGVSWSPAAAVSAPPSGSSSPPSGHIVFGTRQHRSPFANYTSAGARLLGGAVATRYTPPDLDAVVYSASTGGSTDRVYKTAYVYGAPFLGTPSGLGSSIEHLTTFAVGSAPPGLTGEGRTPSQSL